jgi:hypothetical protein
VAFEWQLDGHALAAFDDHLDDLAARRALVLTGLQVDGHRERRRADDAAVDLDFLAGLRLEPDAPRGELELTQDAVLDGLDHGRVGVFRREELPAVFDGLLLELELLLDHAEVQHRLCHRAQAESLQKPEARAFELAALRELFALFVLRFGLVGVGRAPRPPWPPRGPRPQKPWKKSAFFVRVIRSPKAPVGPASRPGSLAPRRVSPNKTPRAALTIYARARFRQLFWRSPKIAVPTRT